MSGQMADPHSGMISFQEVLGFGALELGPVPGTTDIYSHFDIPAPGVNRLTYVRLTKDRRTVRAFVSCVMNGFIESTPCIALGYAVPVDQRNKGFAKQILQQVIEDQAAQAAKSGLKAIYVEAVIDVDNIPSQRVAESVLKVERENITDQASGRPAYRYTALIECKS